MRIGIMYHLDADPAAEPTSEARVLTVAAQALCFMQALGKMANEVTDNKERDRRALLMLGALCREMLDLAPLAESLFDDLDSVATRLGYELDDLVPETEVIQ